MNVIKLITNIILLFGFCNAATVMIIADDASPTLQYLNIGNKVIHFDVRPGISNAFNKNDENIPIFFGLDAETNLDKDKNLINQVESIFDDKKNEEIPERDIEKDSDEDYNNTDEKDTTEKPVTNWYDQMFYNGLPENDIDLAKTNIEVNEIPKEIDNTRMNGNDLEENLNSDENVVPWFYKPLYNDEFHDQFNINTKNEISNQIDNSNEMTTDNLEENLDSEEKNNLKNYDPYYMGNSDIFEHSLIENKNSFKNQNVKEYEIPLIDYDDIENIIRALERTEMLHSY
ncbi:ring-infected erythrocyte surface antigen-like [Condylostylus longicornis]|uniref:ring-infected erythrocyte surface antigen-like n=1 Tax=Condylostylus longicornis TaxID=2530218 RepID=UPI00244DBD7E|nr:ring-infected erythrocyte surface antigen-like [Condylostylus longicornis]